MNDEIDSDEAESAVIEHRLAKLETWAWAVTWLMALLLFGGLFMIGWVTYLTVR